MTGGEVGEFVGTSFVSLFIHQTQYKTARARGEEEPQSESGDSEHARNEALRSDTDDYADTVRGACPRALPTRPRLTAPARSLVRRAGWHTSTGES